LGSKSQVTLYKGHLGVGVTEPSGQLELAGDERIQEYPPGPMDGYETHIPGHGVFCAYGDVPKDSAYYAGWPWWKVFDESESTAFHGKARNYDSTTPFAFNGQAHNVRTKIVGGSEIRGEFIDLKCPYEIMVKSMKMNPRDGLTYGGYLSRMPSKCIFVGSNDGTEYEILSSHSGIVYSGAAPYSANLTINATKLYKHIRLIITHLGGGSSGSDGGGIVNMGHLRYFGTPGPTTLDKGDLSLTRSISNLPLIKGSDYEVPKFKQLRMYLNTDINPLSGGDGSGYGSTTFNRHVYDISYGNKHAVLGANVIWDPSKQAMYFNGSTGGNPEVAYTSDLGFSGDREHSVSLWFWSNDAQSTFGTNEHALYSTGNVDGGVQTGISLYNTFAQVWRSGGATKYPMTFNANQWNHICMTYSTGGSVNSRLWLNGVEIAQDSSVTSTNAYSFDAKDFLIIGDWINNAGNVQESYPWHGYISNFKLWGAVLTQEDALTEYKRGRVAKKSLVMSDVYLGVGCNPSCHLDVMGSARISGGLTLDRGLLVHQTPGSHHITVCGVSKKMTSGGTAERVAFLRATFPNSYAVGVIHLMGSLRTNNSGLQNNFHYMIGLRAMINGGTGLYASTQLASTGYMSSPTVISEPGSQISTDGNNVRTINFEFNTNALLNAGGTYCVWTAHCEFSHPEFSVTPNHMF